MSEFTENTKKRTEALTEYIQGLINNQDGIKLLEKYKIHTTRFEPLEVIYAFDNVFEKIQDIEKIKTASNKLFNILYKNLRSLNIEQLELIFSNLPVDMTYANDEVKFYSDPKHRIFPRTKSIIGRKLQNCHPHESVHIVNRIVEAFKKGGRRLLDW